VNYSANLSEQQSQFLDAMATQFHFGSDTLTVFLNRFDKANRNQDNSSLAIKVVWNRNPEDKTQKFQDELTKICQVLEENGCPIEKPKRGRQPKGKSPWEQAFKWLWEIKFSEWQQSQKELAQTVDIDTLVKQVREKVSADIQKRCGWMRVLDMTQPIGLNDIYTEVNILEKITGCRRLEIGQLLEKCNPEDFERFGLNQVVEKRVPGLAAVEKYSKLMILGKPGAGKTTFLKRIAIQCKLGQFLADHVAIFITLKDFAEAPHQPNLLQYINDQFVINDISHLEITKTLLRQGRVIVLLDGLDEVKQAHNDRVSKEIRNFSTQYDANYFVITCRIASKEYTFEQFTEVEVADFDDKQIAEFATKWFKNKEPKKAEHFIQKLQGNQRIKELATNPLLLTLLCLLFGETTDFPSNRAELYEEGIEVLLKKWDGTRSIERTQVYRRLSLKRKEDLLSKIALETFVDCNYFFKERLVEEYMSDYIQNLPDAQTDPEALLLDSKAVLKSIEAQHGLLVERARGIYSFSHLTFHEFFTAREIKERSALGSLVEHITDKRWQEVFLLTTALMLNANDLVVLMKQKIDSLLAIDGKLQEFLVWLDEKARSVDTPYKPVAVRAFYTLDLRDYIHFLDRNLSWELARYHEPAIDPDFERDYDDWIQQLQEREAFEFWNDDSESNNSTLNPSERDRTPFNWDLAVDFDLDQILAQDLNSANFESLTTQLEFAILHVLDSQLRQKLQSLHTQLSASVINNWEDWMQENGHVWTEQLRKVIIEHRNIGHDWQFNDDQRKLLQQYYDANKLLVDCLNSECYVSRSVRQEIEDTLLLPVNRT
jgi:predicted NACHT family NTPase